MHIWCELEEDNLELSGKKTGFVVSNVEAKRMLQEKLPPGGPMVHDVMRDLDVGCAAGRLRRILTMKNRRKKASNKTRKLQTLKIQQRALRLCLYEGQQQDEKAADLENTTACSSAMLIQR